MYSWWNTIHWPSINETETICFPFLLSSTWRHADLECIHSQLKSSKVKKMEMLLEAVESSYTAAFNNILQDVVAGNDTSYTTDETAKLNEIYLLRCSTCLIEELKRDLRWLLFTFAHVVLSLLNRLGSNLSSPALEEAKDICTYLRPLQRLFEDMETAEFSDVRGQIGPLMHTVCLVWANSKYYSSPARLIVLLQETCNLLIQQVKYNFFSGSSDTTYTTRFFFFKPLCCFACC